MVTHHVEEILPAIDNVIIMADGAVQHQGPKSEVVTREKIGAIYENEPRRIVAEEGRYWPIW